MADIRCPMCGKPNPEERETCQFCDARLKPLIINQPDDKPAGGIGKQQAPNKADDLQGGMLDWLTSLQPAQESETPKEATAGDVPDWLSDMRSDFGESSQPAEEEKGAASEDMDWLSRLGGPTPAEEEPPVSSPPAATPQKRVSSGMTDWFKSLSEETQGEEAPKPTGETLPDWLAGSKAETPEPAKEETLGWMKDLGDEAKEPAGDELPDWLSGAEEAGPQEPGTKEPAGDLSMDWLTGLKSEPEKAAAEPAGEAETLDWLSSFDLEEPSTAVESPLSWGAEQPKPVQPAESEALPAPAGEAEPDWLKELETNFSAMPDTEKGTPPAPVVPPKEGVNPFAIQEDDMGAALESALPDWLSETATDDADRKAAEAAPGLSPGDLPSWLEAMRPVEAEGIPGKTEENMNLPVEGAGPLAGLRGVLPAEPDIVHVRKPPVYSVKLQVSDIQQAQSDLLEQIVRNEGEALPVPGRPVITSQHVLRILIGVILTLAILAPMILGIPVIAPPAINPDVFVGEFQARQVIESMAPGQPVLLVVDYEPGFSGEMEAATRAVLNHLSLKGVYLTLVSSTPTGPIQAERLMAAIKMNPENYQNLGFVSGGTSGLLSFIENPRQTLPVTWDGKAAWDASALLNVNSLEDFALVIVATESAEAGRAWIEQAQPRLNGKPMLLVASAQIDPIMRPYFEAYPRQIQGLVSGLAGGAAYESSFGRPGTASSYWSAFSVGLLIACLLVILGGALNAMAALMANSKKTTGKEG